MISKQELDEAIKLGRRNQRELNGIQAQVAVVNAGVEFWISALEWGRKRRLLTEQEKSILSVAADIPRQTPSDKQSERVIQILSKQNSNGYEPTVSE